VKKTHPTDENCIRKKTAQEEEMPATQEGSRARAGTYVPNAEEDYMNPRQLDYFRRLLESSRRDLLVEDADRDRDIGELREEQEAETDLNDRINQEPEIAMEMFSRDRDNRLLSETNTALERIDSGEYGYCSSCGREIGLARLQARPTTILCIDCKTQQEKLLDQQFR